MIESEEDILQDTSWRAVQSEAQIAATQVAHGVTMLGRANHAQIGFYTQAFFGLSIGFERMGKLIFLAAHAIQHRGIFPSDQDLRAIGHDIASLLSKCEEIGAKLEQDRPFKERPANSIHRAIEEVLSLFARKLRYYNLNYLAGSSAGQDDPIALWWQKVAVLICDKHYSMRQRKVDDRNGQLLDQRFADNTFCFHTGEDGNSINSLQLMYTRGRATQVVQKYGRLYVLQIARWLASILFELAHQGAYVHRIKPLLGIEEPFAIFHNEDNYLKERKTWSIYS